MKPIQPMSPDRIEWEAELTRLIIERAECSNSDAQGIIEAHQNIVDTCYADDRMPADAADAMGLTTAPPAAERVKNDGFYDLRAAIGVGSSAPLYRHQSTIRALLEQRAELLAALEAEEEWREREDAGQLDPEWDYETMVGAKRRAAIAKATGSAS